MASTIICLTFNQSKLYGLDSSCYFIVQVIDYNFWLIMVMVYDPRGQPCEIWGKKRGERREIRKNELRAGKIGSNDIKEIPITLTTDYLYDNVQLSLNCISQRLTLCPETWASQSVHQPHSSSHFTQLCPKFKVLRSKWHCPQVAILSNCVWPFELHRNLFLPNQWNERPDCSS